MKNINNIARISFIAAVAAALSACGGGGGSSSPAVETPPAPVVKTSAVSGTAAVGSPIANGTVSIKCASGATSTTTTGTTGTWSATFKDTDYPCVAQVSGGTANGGNNAQTLHTFVLTGNSTANITPITDLVVGALFDKKPSDIFSAPKAAELQAINATNTAAAVTEVKAILATLPGKPALPDGVDPITTTFTPAAGNKMDDMLETYGTSLKAAGVTQEQAATGVATNTALTQKAFAAKAFSTPGLDGFQIGSSINLDNTFGIAIADIKRGNYTAKAQIDTDGNVTSFVDAGQLTGVVSKLGNRVGMFCAANEGKSQGQYVFASTDMVEVTNLGELVNQTFTEYADCAAKDTVTFDANGTAHYSNGESDNGIAAVFSANGANIDGSNVRAKAYKYTDTNGATKFAFVVVATKIGSTASVINGTTDYLLFGVQ